MEPKYIIVGQHILKLDSITSMRPARQDETDGTYMLRYSGTMAPLSVSKADGDPLWNWLARQAVNTAELASD